MMKFLSKLILLFLLAQYKNNKSIYANQFHIEHSTSDGVILAGIITQILDQYFSEKNYFVSIVLSLSKEDDNHFQVDFFNELLDHPTLTKFSLNILNELEQPKLRTKNTFHLVLVDNYKSIQ